MPCRPLKNPDIPFSKHILSSYFSSYLISLLMYFKNRPENSIQDGVVLASMWIRLSAFLVDMALVMVVYFLLGNFLKWCGVVFSGMYISEFNHVELKGIEAESNLGRLLSFLLSMVPILYFTLITYFSNGKTLGKMIFRIRIVSLYHSKINFWHCLERSLGYVASFLEAGLGFFQAFWNPNRMSLHDKIAETVVIRLPSRNRVQPSEDSDVE